MAGIVGDCIEVMPTFAAASFDCVITSPPYDAEKAYEGRRDLAAYTAFAEAWTAQIPRLLKPRGSFWLNLGYTKLGSNETLPLTYLYYPILSRLGLKLVQELVWHFEGGMAYKNRFSHRTERWMWFALDPDAVKFNLDSVRDITLNRTNDARNNPLGKNPTDYWYFDRVTNNSAAKGNHPCPFPQPMIERIVRACTDEGDAVLDPFGGSGTVERAAGRLGRHATSIELRSEYRLAA